MYVYMAYNCSMKPCQSQNRRASKMNVSDIYNLLSATDDSMIGMKDSKEVNQLCQSSNFDMIINYVLKLLKKDRSADTKSNTAPNINQI